MPDHFLCRTDQLAEGRGRPASAGGRYLAVFLVDGQVRVLDNRCLHVGNPLDGGAVVDGVLHCPWHGWSYDVATGELLTIAGRRPGLTTYPCRVEDGSVTVTVEGPVGD
ncbi:MAG TPA: Rieske (2Fe-2S) protein [Acidimicrobiales bacterium]|nr:Rieske (2Fe-2S) protein [Acidimicrobiales bacterium]